jgi:glutathione peroxidase
MFSQERDEMANSIYDFQCKTISDELKPMSDYKGKVLLIVNTASNCGFTPQYEGLEKLYQRYKEKGFEVLGFPCNQFLGQEPGTEEEIQDFCTTRFSVSFPMFGKVDVNGADADPLYKFLRNEAKGLLGSSNIKWNFTKFLVDKNGKVVKRFATATKPEMITGEIEKLLG